MTISNKVIQISQPNLGAEELALVKEVLESGWLTQGPKTKEFETKFAQYIQTKHAMAATSCTTALHLGLIALGVGPGDEVIVPSFTWVATANAVEYCGGTPVIADCDPKTYNIKVEGLKKLKTSKTKAIIPVHLFGSCADIHAIQEELPGVGILEDAACAVGAKYKGKFSGTLGDVAAFSFHPRKVLTTGEGGMVTTNNDTMAEHVNRLRSHGGSISEEQRHSGAKPYLLPEFNEVGYNYRMTDIQSAIGIIQLQKLESFIQEREKWAKYFNEQFESIPWLKTPTVLSGGRHSLQAYVCYVDPNKAPMKRNDIMEFLMQKGINTRPGTHSIHQLGFYKDKYRLNNDMFPGATLCADQTIALPLHNKMSEEDYNYVSSVIKNIK